MDESSKPRSPSLPGFYDRFTRGCGAFRVLRSTAHWCRSQWPLIILLLTTSLVIVNWFTRGNYVFFIDSYFPFAPSKNISQMFGAWTDYNGVGTLNVSSLPLVPYIFIIFVLNSVFQIPLQISEATVFVGVALLGTLGMYLLVQELSFIDAKLSRLAAFGAAIMYIASPVNLLLYWYLNFPGDAGIIAVAPLVTFFLLRGVRRSTTTSFDLSSLAAVGIMSLILGTATVPYVVSSAIIVALAVTTAVPRLLKARRSRRLRSPLTFVSLALATLFGVNAYWLVPDGSAIHYITGPNAYDSVTDLLDLQMNSRLASPFSVATLQYFPAFNQWANWAQAYQHSFELSVLLPTLVGGIIVLALLAPKRGRASLRDPTFILGLSVVYLVSVMLISGNNVNSPFANVYVTIFQSYVILAPFLRGPYLSFGPALAFCSAILFGVGLGVLSQWISRVIGGLSRQRPLTPMARSSVAAAPNDKRVVLYIVTTGLIGALIVSTYAAPFWNGAVVTDLKYPATPIIPESVFSVAGIINSASIGGPTIVFPASTGYTLENWSSPYLGPPVLPFSGGSVLENVIPPLGAFTNYIVPMAFTLPTYNHSLRYGQILQLLGMKYAVVDNAAGFNQLTIPSNISAIKWTLNHTSAVSYWKEVGQYSIYKVGHAAARVYAPAFIESDNLSLGKRLNISSMYAVTASNTTDLSAQGLWTSTASICHFSNSSFDICAYWPNATVRNTRGTGFHYPGWAEVTNLAPLNVSVGQYPLIYIWVRTVSSQVNPQIWFSGSSKLREYTGNISQYNRTMSQFVLPSPIQVLSYSGGSLFVYNLAGGSGTSELSNGVLNHVMIELQPVGNYSGSLNATVSIALGVPAFLDPGFNGSSSALVGNAYLAVAKEAVVSPPPRLTYDEISPSTYIVHASGSTTQFVVVLEQTFDEGWQIQLPRGATAVHFVANDFANGWIVRSNVSVPEFTLTFGLQRSVTLGTGVSIAVFGGVLLAAIIQKLSIFIHRKNRPSPPQKPTQHNSQPDQGKAPSKEESNPVRSNVLKVAFLVRTLWPGSFCRIAIEEASGLNHYAKGLDSRVLAFSKVYGSYTYDDLIQATSASVELVRCPSVLRRASRAIFLPFVPWIRNAESVVPVLEMAWWALFNNDQFSVNYCEDQFTAFAALLRNRFRGTPYCMFIAEPISHPAGIIGLRVVRGRVSARVLGWVVRAFERYTLSYASAVAFVSIRTHKAVIAEFPQLAKVDSKTLYPGCHPDSNGPTHLNRLSYFLCASKWDYGRNPEFAIELARRLPIQIVLAGSWVNDEARRTFEEQYKRSTPQLRGRVTVTGALGEAELLRIYRGAYAYIHWSKEGFGMGVLESMACGVPPICVCDSGAAEIVKDGVSGILVKSDDADQFSAAIGSISHDVKLRDQLAKGAWKVSCELSWERHVARVAELLRISKD